MDTGAELGTLAASESFSEATSSPSAAIIFALFSHSISASSAIARVKLSGITISLVSTTVTSLPHGQIWASSTFLIVLFIACCPLR